MQILDLSYRWVRLQKALLVSVRRLARSQHVAVLRRSVLSVGDEGDGGVLLIPGVGSLGSGLQVHGDPFLRGEFGHFQVL